MDKGKENSMENWFFTWTIKKKIVHELTFFLLYRDNRPCRLQDPKIIKIPKIILI